MIQIVKINIYDVIITQEYAGDNSRWVQKDAAIYLVTSLANQGATRDHGATRRNQFVDVEQFFHQQIVPELQNADRKNLLLFIRLVLL